MTNDVSLQLDRQNPNVSTGRHVDDLLCTQQVFFPMLETLRLRELDKLEVIWNAPIPEGSNSFKNLRQLSLYKLPAMTHLWKSPSRNISLSNLSEIHIDECRKLRSLFSPTMSMDFLLQLAELEIRSCKMMEQVLLNEENENDRNQCRTIQFPKLWKLTLDSLESLTTFSKGIESIEFPMLNHMNITNCPKLMSLPSSTGNNQNSADGHDDDTFHLFCSQKVSLGSLSNIQIGTYDISNMWCHQISPGFFRQLQKLRIWDCNGIRSLFTFSIVENLVSLRKLKIADCAEMVKLIEDDEEMLREKPHQLFPSLKALKFHNLPKLESFCNWRSDLLLPSLEKVSIINCHPLLEFFTTESVSFGGAKEILIGDDNIDNIWCHQIPLGFFSQLEMLTITGCNGIRSLFSSSIAVKLVNLKELRIWNCAEMVKVIEDDEELGFFCQLEKLVIHGCNGIRSLFSSSIAVNLVNLKELRIRNCAEMVKVIEDDEEMLCEKPLLLFPSLKELEFVYLPKLKSFCNWRCHLLLPSLESVEIASCPLLEFFTMESVSTKNLKSIKINYQTKDVGDLNGTIQLYFEANQRQLISSREESTSDEAKEVETDDEKSEIEEEEIEEAISNN